MEIQVLAWEQTTKKIYQGVLIYSICGVLDSIISPIVSLTGKASAIASFAGGGSGGFSGIFSAENILPLLIIVGYIMYLLGLNEFKKILPAGDSSSVGKILTATILVIVAMFIGFLPLMGWVKGILSIIAFILMIIGYSNLKDSGTFPEMARKGASKLFTAMILSLVGVVIGFIPLVGGFIKMVLLIVAFFMIFSGWKHIKNAVQQA